MTNNNAVRRFATVAMLAALVGGLGSCSNATGPETVLASVTPAGGATGVSPTTSVTMTFTHAMDMGMEMYVSLHEGDVTGPLVSCTATWSGDHTRLTLQPMASLKAGTHYTIRIAGGMKDANGEGIDMTPGSMMGGQWETGSMMPGMMRGMVFAFTTS